MSQIKSPIVLIKNRLLMKWVSLKTWRLEKIPYWSWFYSLESKTTKKGDHVLQLSLIGFNIGFKYRDNNKKL